MATGGGERSVAHSKLVLLGNAGVGKSCLVLRFVRNEFYEEQETTIGAAFLTQSITLDSTTVRFEIWDTAGQERYRSLAPMYYRGAAAAIVVFSVADMESFNGAKTWVKELQRRGDPNVVIALAGNKADLTTRQVKTEEAQEYAAENEIFYIETSAKDSMNVVETFTEIAKRLPKHHEPTKKEPFPVAPKKEGCCN